MANCNYHPRTVLAALCLVAATAATAQPEILCTKRFAPDGRCTAAVKLREDAITNRLGVQGLDTETIAVIRAAADNLEEFAQLERDLDLTITTDTHPAPLDRFVRTITWAWPPAAVAFVAGIWRLIVLLWILAPVIAVLGVGFWLFLQICYRWPLLGWFLIGIMRGLTSGGGRRRRRRW